MPRSLSTAVLLLACMMLVAKPVAAQTAADSAAIRATALNYIEGWYSGDGDRMASALHPELAKRIVESSASGWSRLDNMSAAQLIDATRNRNAGAKGRSDVVILDIFRNVAAVRVDADSWIDYMHLARWNGEWKIVNVLWELRQP